MVIWWHAPASTALSPAAIRTARKTGRVRQTWRETLRPHCSGLDEGDDDDDDDQNGSDSDEDNNGAYNVTTPSIDGKVHLIPFNHNHCGETIRRLQIQDDLM